MANLVKKLKNAAMGLAIGASALVGSSDSKGAGVMKISTTPTYSTWVADGSTGYELDVYLTRDANSDGVADANQIRGISSWRVTMPTTLKTYLTPVSASLPDPNNKKSQNINDVLYNLDMQTIGGAKNIVNNFDATGVSSGNCRDPPQTAGTYSSQMGGVVAKYILRLDPNAPTGSTNFKIDAITVYDKNGQAYISTGGGNSATMNVVNNAINVVSLPGMALENVVNGTIVKGGTANISLDTRNSVAANSAALGYNLTVSGDGAVSLGALTNSTGNLTSGNSLTSSTVAGSSSVGVHNLTFAGTGNYTAAGTVKALPNQPGSVGATLTVLDNSLGRIGTGTSQTINLGNSLRGAIVSAPITISNESRSDGFRVGLSYVADANTRLVQAGTGANTIAINLPSFAGNSLAQGTSATGSVSLDTTHNGASSKNATISVEDTKGLSGAAGSQTLGLYVYGNVGNANADKSNLQNVYGQALNAHVHAGEIFGNGSGLESIVTSSSGSGGASVIGTEAILRGTALRDANVSMAWRARTQSETSLKEGGSPDYSILPALSSGLISDVVKISDDSITQDISGTIAGSTLKMNYGQLGMSDSTEQSLISDNLIYIARWDGALNQYVKVGDTQVVDAMNNSVEVNIGGPGSYAVIPEPATTSLLALGGLALLARGGARRRKDIVAKAPFKGTNYLSGKGLDKGMNEFVGQYLPKN